MIVLLWDACSPRHKHRLVSILTIYCTICTVLLYPTTAQGKSEPIRISTQEKTKVTQEQITTKSFGHDDHEKDDDGFHIYDELTHTESLAVVEDSINVFAKDIGVAFSDLLDSSDDSKDFVEQVNDLMDDDHHSNVDHSHGNSKYPTETPNRTNSLPGDHDDSNHDHNPHSAHDHSSHGHNAHDHTYEDHIDHDHKEHEHDHGHATFIFPKDKNEATEIHIDEHNHSENVEHEDVAMLVENAEDESFLTKMGMNPASVKKQYFGWLRRNEGNDNHDHNSNDIDHDHNHDDHDHEDHDHSHDDHDDSYDDHDHSHDDQHNSHDDHDHSHDDHDHSYDDHDHSYDDHHLSHDDHGHSHDNHDHRYDDQHHSHDNLGHSHDNRDYRYDDHDNNHNDHDHSYDNDHSTDDHDHSGHEGHSHAAKGRALSDITGSTWLVACASVLVISLVGVISVAFLPLLSNERGEAILQAFICIAVGTLVGDSFIHLAPHALTHSHSPETTWKGFLASMVVMAFITLDKILSFMGVKHSHSHVTVFEPIIKNDQDQDKLTDDSFSQASTMMAEECGSLSNASILHETVSGTGKHPHKHKVSNTNLMVIIGDAIHNFADGIAIGAAFSIGYGPGLSTSIAVLCHELPHEIGDFAILIQNGMTIKTALFYNLVSSVTGFLGMCLGMVMGSNGDYSSWMIAGIMGVFLYVALVSMLPEITANTKLMMACNIGGMILGVVLLLVIGLYEEDIIYLLAV